MTVKNFGAGVSGYAVPDGRAWETVAFKSGKPVLDRELNLLQDVGLLSGQGGLRLSMPSGWLSEDFLGTSDPTSAILIPNTIANTLQVPHMLAHVNGWLIKVQNTNATGLNQLQLTVGPTGAGAQRADFVFLEVFRKLVPAAPATEGKSANGRIWQEGNVKTNSAADTTLNYADDTFDVNVGQETTKRVQIQYRLRAVAGIDLFAYPYGLDAPTVVANSAPTDAATPDGTATTFTYVNQSSAGDPGLWVAGDGNAGNTLGTVDGYMYAIPLLGIFRRSTTAFDWRTNQNGGVATPGPSDRPDGFFHDVIAPEDIVDLRHGVSPNGWPLAEVLEKTTNYILDNSLRTEIASTPDGGGSSGTTILRVNQIGVLPGNNTTTGNTGAGAFIGQFDGVRRRFSDRAVLESVTLKVAAPSGGWTNSAVVTIAPNALPIYPAAAPFDWDGTAPAGARVVDLLFMRWAGGAPPLKTYNAISYVKSVTGLGTRGTLSITFNTSVTGLVTTEPLYITLLVAYPAGLGLTHTPVASYGAKSFLTTTGDESTSSLPAFGAWANRSIDPAHREVRIEYTSAPTSFVSSSDSAGAAASIVLPERADSVMSVTVGSTPVPFVALSNSGRSVSLWTSAAQTTPFTTSAGQTVSVAYTALRVVPKAGIQTAIQYRAAAPQTARTELLPGTLTLNPKVAAPYLYTITAGSGSQDEGYPFPYACVQSGGVYPGSGGLASYAGEADLAAPGTVAVGDFSANTGLPRLPILIPMVPNPEALSFIRVPEDIDVESRTFYKSTSTGYVPNAYAQNLSLAGRHKNVYPVLGQLSVDCPLGPKGALVVVLLARYAILDDRNGVYFSPSVSTNTTTASVFRVKGLLLGARY